MPYQYHLYNFQDAARGDAAAERINDMEKDGWAVHTVSANFVEVGILWYKAASARGADEPEGNV